MKFKLNGLKKSLCIVVCSNGYPDEYKKNIEIRKLNQLKLNQDEFLFHAGTQIQNKKIYSIGGRVLNFVKLSKNFSDAREKVIKNIKKLNWKDGFYRKDIGHKVIEK